MGGTSTIPYMRLYSVCIRASYNNGGVSVVTASKYHNNTRTARFICVIHPKKKKTKTKRSEMITLYIKYTLFKHPNRLSNRKKTLIKRPAQQEFDYPRYEAHSKRIHITNLNKHLRGKCVLSGAHNVCNAIAIFPFLFGVENLACFIIIRDFLSCTPTFRFFF